MEVFMTVILMSFMTSLSYSQAPPIDDNETVQELTMRKRSHCNKTIDMKFNHEKYTISTMLDRYRCLESQKGFRCEVTFRIADPFDLLGHEICVDLQGVDEGMRDKHLSCQLNVNVESKSEILKGVYCSTRLKPENSSYYICSQGEDLSLALLTLPSVKVCPEILEQLYNQKVLLGSVSLRPKSSMPVYEVYLGSCENPIYPDEDAFAVKVFTPQKQCSPYMRTSFKMKSSKMRGCLTLIYMAKNYFCNIDVKMNSRRDNSMLQLTVQRDYSDLPYTEPASICKDFDADNGDVILNIQVFSENRCYGKFAFQVSFTVLEDTDDEPAQINSPRVFMAVFIALISLCLICLAFTCWCCIRSRRKRLRHLRRSRHGAPNSNHAFEDSLQPMPYYEGNISWSQSEPGRILGLPSYEDVTGIRPDGANPVGDSVPKADLPPSYDSIFSSSEL